MKKRIADSVLFSPAYTTCLLDGNLALGTYSEKDGGYIALSMPWAVEKIQCLEHKNITILHLMNVQIGGKMTPEGKAWWKMALSAATALIEELESQQEEYLKLPIPYPKPNSAPKAEHELTAAEVLSETWRHPEPFGEPTRSPRLEELTPLSARKEWLLENFHHFLHPRTEDAHHRVKEVIYHPETKNIVVSCPKCKIPAQTNIRNLQTR